MGLRVARFHQLHFFGNVPLVNWVKVNGVAIAYRIVFKSNVAVVENFNIEVRNAVSELHDVVFQ